MGFIIENGVLTNYEEESGVTEIVIPDGVTSIGDWAFHGCESLTSITIPNGVTSIGEYAFSDCESLTSITISDSVTSIGDWAFHGCEKLTSIIIPDSVTRIGESAFSDCNSLTSITIPDSVTSIGKSAFEFCESLTSITISDSVTSIGEDVFNFTPWFEEKISENTVVIAGHIVIKAHYKKCSGDLVIPDGVTSIGDAAFSGCESLTSITIPDSVTSIGDRAFYECKNLKSITILGSVTNIGESAFWGCISLTSIECAENNMEYSSVDGVLFGENGKKLIRYPSHKADEIYTVPDGVTEIEDYAFSYCNCLKKVVIPESVKKIGELAFSKSNNIAEVELPDSVEEIGRLAFCCDYYSGRSSHRTHDHDIKFILYKGDVKFSFYLLGNWGLNSEEQTLNWFICSEGESRKEEFVEIKTADYKFPLAVFMMFAYPEETYYQNYVKRNIKKIVKKFIDDDDIAGLCKLLETGFITKRNIDELMTYAIENTQNGGSLELQMVLMKYKDEKIGYQDMTKKYKL